MTTPLEHPFAAVPAVVKQAVVIAIAVLPSLELQQYAAGVVRAVWPGFSHA